MPQTDDMQESICPNESQATVMVNAKKTANTSTTTAATATMALTRGESLKKSRKSKKRNKLSTEKGEENKDDNNCSCTRPNGDADATTKCPHLTLIKNGHQPQPQQQQQSEHRIQMNGTTVVDQINGQHLVEIHSNYDGCAGLPDSVVNSIDPTTITTTTTVTPSTSPSITIQSLNVNIPIQNGIHSNGNADDNHINRIPNKSIDQANDVPSLTNHAVDGICLLMEKSKLDDLNGSNDGETTTTCISNSTTTTTTTKIPSTSSASQSSSAISSTPLNIECPEIGGEIIKSDISIVYNEYENELQMPDIMRLIQKDLSEPYSIYTYRYFIHNWPKLCFLAMHGDRCVGAIVCKLDFHRQIIKRGYIAMLAVDKDYRKLKIGTNLVQKAIQAMLLYNADEVVLETELTNLPALRLYENLGFVRDKRLFGYYLNGVDALRLKLWFR